MEIVAIIPVSGRETLLKHTVARLKKQTIPIRVMCCGHTDSEREVCEEGGAEFIQVASDVLTGTKWQMMVNLSKEKYNPDALLILGSANFISDNWCEEMTKYLVDGVKLVGVMGLYYMHIWFNGKPTMYYFPGYPVGHIRHVETVGIGRIIPRSTLDALDWKLFEDVRRSNDSYMMRNINRVQGVIAKVTDAPICAMRISSPKWKQLNSFNAFPQIFKNIRWLDANEINHFLLNNFPEAVNLEL